MKANPLPSPYRRVADGGIIGSRADVGFSFSRSPRPSPHQLGCRAWSVPAGSELGAGSSLPAVPGSWDRQEQGSAMDQGTVPSPWGWSLQLPSASASGTLCSLGDTGPGLGS